MEAVEKGVPLLPYVSATFEAHRPVCSPFQHPFTTAAETPTLTSIYSHVSKREYTSTNVVVYVYCKNTRTIYVSTAVLLYR